MSYNFLIVDQSATTRARIKRVIRLADLSPGVFFEAGDGHEALEVLAEHRVDLVLADLNMPGMNGFEMIGRILSEPATRSVPVVIVSANPDMRQIQQIQKLRRAGAKGYLPKPFTPEAVHQVVGRILEPTHA